MNKITYAETQINLPDKKVILSTVEHHYLEYVSCMIIPKKDGECIKGLKYSQLFFNQDIDGLYERLKRKYEQKAEEWEDEITRIMEKKIIPISSRDKRREKNKRYLTNEGKLIQVLFKGNDRGGKKIESQLYIPKKNGR